MKANPISLVVAIFVVITCSLPATGQATAVVEINYRDTIEEIASAIEEQYPIETKGQSIASAIREAAELGVIAESSDKAAFIDALNTVLWDAAHDLHLRVHDDAELSARLSAGGGRVPRMRRVAAPDNEDGGAEPAALGTTEIETEMLDEETGLVTIASPIFNNPSLFTDKLSSLLDAKNIIIDLRKTPGGTVPGVQYFISQFYNEPTHVLSRVSREFDEPQEVWTVETPIDDEFESKNIYILTSQKTGSGAEATSYAFKESGRAVLIGEKTAGAGNAGAFLNVAPGISLFLPVSQTISPVTGEPWEGNGIEPHISIPASDALDVALMTIDEEKFSGDASVEK